MTARRTIKNCSCIKMMKANAYVYGKYIFYCSNQGILGVRHFIKAFIH